MWIVTIQIPSRKSSAGKNQYTNNFVTRWFGDASIAFSGYDVKLGSIFKVIHTLAVNTKNESYPLYIGQGLLSDTALINQHISGNQVLVVTNPSIASFYLEPFLANFKSKQCDYLLLPEGETAKNLSTWGTIIDSLMLKKHLRSTTLIALGGGVVGDMTGFAAACYQRGVGLLQVPTTLLAQVDSSIGGKTGVNHALGKNMIGAFYPPKAVFIDIDTLSTLPRRELAAGFAEVIKHGLIADAAFFDWLETHQSKLLTLNPEALLTAIKRSCEIKAAIVSQDEYERTGQRVLLNFGHTFGHAIETVTNYNLYLHGEAVAIGMVLACQLSEKLGYIDSAFTQRVVALLTAFQLPTQLPPDLSLQDLTEEMQRDKKRTDAGLMFIVLEKPGKAVLTAVSIYTQTTL
ncbi:MAG: 3-dehydroquinate synthase [Legionellales bacterium]|nr:3-dehydroquinate synthase [Legionellales bacterium]